MDITLFIVTIIFGIIFGVGVAIMAFGIWLPIHDKRVARDARIKIYKMIENSDAEQIQMFADRDCVSPRYIRFNEKE